MTNAALTDAQRLLKRHGWSLEAAIGEFYSDPAAQARAANGGNSKRRREAQAQLEALFSSYADEDGEINIEGTQRYFADLDVALDDVLVLPLCYYLGAPSMGRFTRDGFVAGWLTLDAADTLESQKAVLPALRRDFQTDAQAKPIVSLDPSGTVKPPSNNGLYSKVYEFTFTFARPEGQKSLGTSSRLPHTGTWTDTMPDLDSAIAFWELIMPYSPTFTGNGGTFTPGQLAMWIEFLRSKTKGRAVSKDSWNLFLEFTADIDQHFSNHDEMGAWPSVIDDFVAYAKEETEAGRGPATKMDTS